MQVTVFGATGKVGRLVVQKLLTEGHSVVAFVHRQSSLPEHPKMTTVQGDVHQGEDIKQALVGSDAVISALGSWHTPDKNTLSSAMESLIPAMRELHLKRIITVTGSGAFSDDDKLTAFDRAGHALFNVIAPKVLRDSEEHIRLLSESGLEWTVLRSPPMNESGTVEYQLEEHFPRPWQTIHRHAVADCMVALLTDVTHNHEAPFITRN